MLPTIFIILYNKTLLYTKRTIKLRVLPLTMRYCDMDAHSKHRFETEIHSIISNSHFKDWTIQIKDQCIIFNITLDVSFLNLLSNHNGLTKEWLYEINECIISSEMKQLTFDKRKTRTSKRKNRTPLDKWDMTLYKQMNYHHDNDSDYKPSDSSSDSDD